MFSRFDAAYLGELKPIANSDVDDDNPKWNIPASKIFGKAFRLNVLVSVFRDSRSFFRARRRRRLRYFGEPPRRRLARWRDGVRIAKRRTSGYLSCPDVRELRVSSLRGKSDSWSLVESNSKKNQ